MYVGRDMTELSMMGKNDWTDKELAFFHKNLQQIAPYLNTEGVTIHKEIIKEIMNRGGLHHEAEWTSGSRVHYD
ncbi:cytosolic protein [Bacillus shivajii]|uniref:cytosolic protein n=1 Tax=Bacillus shivajii TaxID=1983719 RepID=UPI001CFA8B1F|nr:cytosolic protein [Bacillus shivajii]UCZ54107.1 cytosolic protein [Bacillus shivajii]